MRALALPPLAVGLLVTVPSTGQMPEPGRDVSKGVRLMRNRGYSPDEIRKIAGGNYLRVFNL